jgi:hypothetical protein
LHEGIAQQEYTAQTAKLGWAKLELFGQQIAYDGHRYAVETDTAVHQRKNGEKQ